MNNQVNLISGLGWPFTVGGTKELEYMIDILPPEAEARHFPHFMGDTAYNTILEFHKKYPKAPIMLGGHSMGVYEGIKICDRLDKKGIKVKYFAAIDPTAIGGNMRPMVVPNNVEFVDEFWSTRGFINFPKWARSRDPKGGDGGMLIVPEGMKHEVIEVDAGHIGCARHEDTQNRIIFQVGKWLGEGM